jgi:vancomycin resistance protein YoaR
MAIQNNDSGMTNRERPQSTPTGQRRPTARQIAERKRAARNRKIAIISICAVVLVVLIGLIVGMIVYANRDTDDGRILDNVCAGGVNLGGMTMEEAKNALHLATDNTFSQKNLVIRLPDATITFSPDETGAKLGLDVDAVVQAAYNYGRTGSDAENKKAQQSAATSIHTIALLPYLQLDLPRIQQIVDDFCASYSSTMTQPSVMLRGDRPAFDPEYPDLPVTHQTMVITIGTPDYVLKPSKVYARVLDAYSLNEMDVAYQAPAQTEPEQLVAEKLFAEYCISPEDAKLDDVTFDVTPEVYGYGFDVEKVQKLLNEATYGEVLEIPLGFIEPDITAKDLTENLFLDLLATYTCTLTDATDGWIKNLQLACEAINGTVLKENEIFSFNQLVGRLTAAKGYEKAPGFRSGVETEILGAGVEQVASALYYSALMSDLEVLERHNNGYAVNYIDLGLDACISYGSQDLRFTNNTNSPIRIVAMAEGGSVTINIFGIDNRIYDLKLETEIISKDEPNIIYQTMDKDNVMGYEDGKVLVSGITGYKVKVYVVRLHKQTGDMVSRMEVNTSIYNKRDQKQVHIEGAPTQTPAPSHPEDPGSDILDGISDFFNNLF